MNGLKDLLKKKDSISKDAQQNKPAVLAVPEFRIIRTTTESEEVIEPPHFDGDDEPLGKQPKKERRRTLFSRASSAVIPKPTDPRTMRSDVTGVFHEPYGAMFLSAILSPPPLFRVKHDGLKSAAKPSGC